MKKWKEHHFELVLDILVIHLEIILHIMSCKISAYLYTSKLNPHRQQFSSPKMTKQT